MIASRKKKYYEKEIEKLRQEGSHQTPYKLLRNISDTERPPAWSVSALPKGVTDETLGEQLANYFSQINGQSERTPGKV